MIEPSDYAVQEQYRWSRVQGRKESSLNLTDSEGILLALHKVGININLIRSGSILGYELVDKDNCSRQVELPLPLYLLPSVMEKIDSEALKEVGGQIKNLNVGELRLIGSSDNSWCRLQIDLNYASEWNHGFRCPPILSHKVTAFVRAGTASESRDKLMRARDAMEAIHTTLDDHFTQGE